MTCRTTGTLAVSGLRSLLPILTLIALLGTGVPSGAGADVLVPLPGTLPPTLPDSDAPETGPLMGPLPDMRRVDDVVFAEGQQDHTQSKLFLPLHGALPPGDQQMLFEGQEAVQHFTVTVPVEAVVADVEFVLSYLSSVQLLPSASRLEVFLNGIEVFSFHPDAFSSPKTMRVQVPDGLLRPGRNEVQISLRQNHRVLCTIDSIYELWTAVDALRSGLELRLVEALATPTLATFDHALSSGLSGSRNLTVIAPAGQPDEAWLAKALKVAQGAARRTSGPLPTFSYLSLSELERGEPATSSLLGVRRDALPKGMLALIGTAEELRELLPRQILNSVTGPYLGVHGLGGRNGNALLVFSGRDRQEVEEAVEDWVSQRVELPAGSSAITSELPPAPERLRQPIIAGRSTVDLAQLDVSERQIAGLRQVIPVELRLPDDFFAANDAAVRLYLNGAYAPDLHPDSALNLLVNGRGAALIGLTEASGRRFRNYPVDLPLRFFQPGLNRVEFEVSLPSVNASPQGFCPPGTISLNQPPQFVLHDDTRFVFPAYARLGHLPNLKLLAERGFPYLLNNEQLPTQLYLGDRDPATLSAAMTLSAAIARQAEEPLELLPTFALSQHFEGDTLVVGSLNRLQPEAFGNAPLRQADLVAAWSRSRPFDPLVSGEQEVAASRATGQLLERIETLRRGPTEGERNPARSAPRAAGEEEPSWFRQQLNRLPSWRQREAPEQLARRLLQQAGGDVTAVMMQYQADGESGRSITLVTALDGPLLLAAVRRVTQPDFWSRIGGDLVVWGAQPRSLGSARVGESYTIAPSEHSLTNYRLILSNWLSHNVSVLLISVLMVVLALSSVTYLLLRMDRRRRDLD